MADQPNLERYARQIMFPGLGIEGQRRLLASNVVIIGCGALGSVTASNLVRAGVGKVTIVDRDYVELNNLARQTLFDEDDIARNLPKAIAAAQKLARINSTVEITPVVADVNPGNIERLISPVDLVLDGTDNFETRYLINDTCVKLGKPWIYAGVIASYGMTMNIIPGETPCLRCIFLEPPAPGTAPTCDTAGVLGTIVSVVASLQSTEAMKLLVGAREKLNPGLMHVDVWNNTFLQHSAGTPAADCPACGHHNFEFLLAKEGIRTTVLCGQDAIQVASLTSVQLDLAALAKRLESVGEVAFNQYMLRLRVDGYELTVFPDARTIIKGTTDEGVAKTLHARYIGT